MASDGCREVEWKGQAFPYLLHHPGNLKTENYGRLRAHDPVAVSSSQPGGGPSSDVLAPAGTGTWGGAAPRGFSHVQAGVRESQEAEVVEPGDVLLGSGYRMPMIGLGTYKIFEKDVIRAALHVGYRHFDCASFYRNEALVGEAIQEFLSEGGQREQLFITSKVWNDAHRPEALRASCIQSLKDLSCGYLDLYLVHWPDAWQPGSDPEGGTITEDEGVTLEETWRAMEQLVDDGLVRSIGVSNFSLAQLEQLLASCRIAPVVNQVELHPLLAQRKLVGTCLRKGIRCVAYSPLGHQGNKECLEHPVVVEVASEVHKSPAQVLLKWNLQRGVPVIPKSSNDLRLRENLVDMFHWKLTNSQKARLDSLDQCKRFVSPFWKKWDIN